MPSFARACLVGSATLYLLACGSDSGARAAGAGLPGGGAAPGGGAPDAAVFQDASNAAARSDAALGPVGVLDGGSGACAQVSTGVGLLPVHLAFAFDVSGSMGKGDEDWHDKALKWDPVVLATRSFFEQPQASGVFASLTFFPKDGDEGERCDADAYQEPDVPMTALPSTRFGGAITEIEPESEDDWRGGTPTVFVMRGTRELVASQRADVAGNYAIVLVTDGYPQGCDDEDDSVAAVVSEAAQAARDGVRTYVIGVANPPLDGAPDTVTNLHDIAAAGQTQRAYLVDTGSPSATVSAFSAAVQAIREQSASCAIAIPDPPNGEQFDRQKVAVSYQSRGAKIELGYDAACMGPRGWRYDDAAAPTRIELCPSACEEVKQDPQAALAILFACDTLILL
jgi:hypothetical protein